MKNCFLVFFFSFVALSDLSVLATRVHDKSPAEVSTMPLKRFVWDSQEVNDGIEAFTGHKNAVPLWHLSALGPYDDNPISNFYRSPDGVAPMGTRHEFGRGVVYVHTYNPDGLGSNLYRTIPRIPSDIIKVSRNGAAVQTGLMVSGLGKAFVPLLPDSVQAYLEHGIHKDLPVEISISSQDIPWTKKALADNLVLRPQYAVLPNEPYSEAGYKKKVFDTETAIYSPDNTLSLKAKGKDGAITKGAGHEMLAGYSAHISGANPLVVLSPNQPGLLGLTHNGTAFWSTFVILDKRTKAPQKIYVNASLMLSDHQAMLFSDILSRAHTLREVLVAMKDTAEFGGGASLDVMQGLFERGHVYGMNWGDPAVVTAALDAKVSTEHAKAHASGGKPKEHAKKT